MGFFDTYNIDEINIKEENHAADEFIKAACSYNFGETCYFNTELKKFMYKVKKDDPVIKKCIPIGIIVNQSDDKRIISVANLHYLNADPERLDARVNINMAIWDLFNRYVKAFKDKLPQYKKLKKVFMRPVTIFEMELIKKNKDIFKEQLLNLSSDKDNDLRFFLKYNSGKTIVTKKPIVQNSSNKTPLYKWGPNIETKTIDYFDSVLFLPIFDIPIA